MDTAASGYAFYEYLEIDNEKLFTAVFLPEKSGKFPTVIMRTPYVGTAETEAEFCARKINGFTSWLENGYAVVYQHCRGRGLSSGDFIPYVQEREDGLLLQDWIRKQSFYNGEQYLYGGSYTSTVHFVTAPFAEDIKGAVLEAQDCERYNIMYRNGFFKMGLHGDWYIRNYKKKSNLQSNYTPASYHTLPLSDFSKTVFGEPSEDLDEKLKHPDKNDPFWRTRPGGIEAHEAIKHANIPILLHTGFYDIYTGGVFDMWNGLDAQTKAKSALLVHPFEHGRAGKNQPIFFGSMLSEGKRLRRLNRERLPIINCSITNGTPILLKTPAKPKHFPWDKAK